jgi:hypothetical protein
MTFRWIVTVSALGLAAACGTEQKQAAPSGSGGGYALLVTQAREAPGATCLHGGVVVSAGLDTDGDGALDPAEVARTEAVCDPEPAPPVLTRTSAEPAGARCAAGGTRVDAGRDADRDGALGDAEVERTAWACTDPDLAATVLTRVDPEPASTTCPWGGSALRVGRDLNDDGALDAAEVTEVRRLCETRAAPSFTVRTKADADLVSAARVVDGQLRVEVVEPIDLVLSPTAVTFGISVTSPALTGLSLYCWTVGQDVRVVGNPHLRRFWFGSENPPGGDVVVADNPELTDLLLPDRNDRRLGTVPYRYPGDVVVARNAKLGSFSLGAYDGSAVEVGGTLDVEGNTSLAYLELPGLTRVGGDLVVAGNGALVEFPVLSSAPLASVGGALVVRDNVALVRVLLGKLQTVGGLQLQRNATLAFPRLPALVAIIGDLTVTDNPQLAEITSGGRTSGGALQIMTGGVLVSRNARLTSLRDLDGVVEIGGRLEVSGNPTLRSVGLPRLVRVGDFWIMDNPALEAIGPTPAGSHPLLTPPSLTALESFRQGNVLSNAALRQLVLPALRTADTISASDDPLLPTCQVQAVRARYRYASGTDDTATCP